MTWQQSTARRLLTLLRDAGHEACIADGQGQWLLVDTDRTNEDGTDWEAEYVAATFPAVHQRLYGY